MFEEPLRVVSKGISVYACALITNVISLKARSGFSTPECLFR